MADRIIQDLSDIRLRSGDSPEATMEFLQLNSFDVCRWDDDFLDTYNYLNEQNISYLHVFTYSERSNTDATKIGKVVLKEKRTERSKMLHILSDKKRRYFHNQFIGKERSVLFENIKNGKLWGHTDNYIHVQIDESSDLVNTLQTVQLTDNNGVVVSGQLKFI